MRFISSVPALCRWPAMALLLAASAAAFGADSYSAGKLTIPTLVIGNATYSNVVVNVAGILSGPAGSAPIGTVDTYNPANGQLTVQAVTLGAATVYNVVVSVASLVSVGSVSGADTYDGNVVTVPMVTAGYYTYAYVSYKPTAAPTIAGGMPGELYDSYNGSTLVIPAVTYSGHVFTNVTVAATQQGSPAGSNQTISFSQAGIPDLAIGSAEAIAASSTSGLPVSYVVQTPSVCTLAQDTAHQGYGYITYSAAGGSGSGVVGAVPLGNNAFQANSFTGLTSTGQFLGLGMASSVLNPYPSTSQNYTAPYPNFELMSDDFLFDDVFFVGGPLVDIAGIVLTTAGDPIINILYAKNQGYLYADSIIFAAQGPYQTMAMSAKLVNGLVGLSQGACTVTAFQPGNGTFKAAAPVSFTQAVGEIILP